MIELSVDLKWAQARKRVACRRKRTGALGALNFCGRRKEETAEDWGVLQAGGSAQQVLLERRSWFNGLGNTSMGQARCMFASGKRLALPACALRISRILSIGFEVPCFGLP